VAALKKLGDHSAKEKINFDDSKTLDAWKRHWHDFIHKPQEGIIKPFRMRVLYWLYGQVWYLGKGW